MASALIGSAASGLFIGGIGYVICLSSNKSNPFEKAVLVTVLVGLQTLAKAAIKHQLDDKHTTRSITCVLMASTALLAIPCTLYAGRVFNFKSVNYLTIVGLASLGYVIKDGLSHLYILFSSKGSK